MEGHAAAAEVVALDGPLSLPVAGDGVHDALKVRLDAQVFPGVLAQGGDGLDHQPLPPLHRHRTPQAGGAVVQADALDLPNLQEVQIRLLRQAQLHDLRDPRGLQHRLGQGHAALVQNQIQTLHQSAPFSNPACCSRACRWRRALSGSAGSKFRK